MYRKSVVLATLLSGLLMAFSPVSTQAQTTLIYDSFEYGNITNFWTVRDDFVLDDEIIPDTTWGIVNKDFGRNVGTHSGNSKVWCSPRANQGTTTFPVYPDDMDAIMERELDLRGCTDGTLSVWVKIKMPDSELFSDLFSIYIDDAEVYSSFDLETQLTEWTQVVVPLKDYVGDLHTLRFEFTTDASNEPDTDEGQSITDFQGVFLDDVMVSVSKNNFQPDFNQDGVTDVIFQHTDGRLMTWYFDGAMSFVTNATLKKASSTLRVYGYSDFDNNGDCDILLRNSSTLKLYSWMYTNVTAYSKTLTFAKKPSSGWIPRSMVDYDNDGLRDILFKHTDGRVAFWRMNGVTNLSSLTLAKSKKISTGYDLVSSADFNFDGQKDLLLNKASDGTLTFWYMSGTNYLRTSNAIVRTTGAPFKGWTPRQVTDMNYDGYPDILFQNAAGSLAVAYFRDRNVMELGNLAPTYELDYGTSGKRNIRVTKGAVYFWDRSDSDTSLLNGTQTLTKDATFVASGTNVVIKGLTNAPVTCTVAPLLQILRNGKGPGTGWIVKGVK